MVTLFVGFIDAFGSIKPLVARALGENFVATLNYRMIVKRYINYQVVGGSIPGCESISLLDRKVARWSSSSYVPNRRGRNHKLVQNLQMLRM